MEDSNTAKAARILQDAEQELLYLVGNSAEKGDYQAIATITSWAQTVQSLFRELPSTDRVSSGQSDFLPVPPPKRLVKPLRQNDPKVYPLFYRERSTLVKVGWSKTQKAEYEHRVPELVLDDVLNALAKHLKSGSRFNMETLLPISAAGDGTELPSYQPYLCIAWLRKEGLVMQHGRQGYSIKPSVDIVRRAKEAFQSLPARRQ